MALTVEPRVARIHYRSDTNDLHVTATGINVIDFLNKVFKGVSDVADLATAIAFILAEFAPMGEDGAVASTLPAGNLHNLAAAITATYPAGYLPSHG